MDWALLLSYSGLMFIAGITPGPNNFMLMSSGALFGFRRTIPHILGVVIGFPFLLIICVYGLGAILIKMPVLVSAVKTIGALWLVWLAFKFFLAAKQIHTKSKSAKAQNNESKPGSRPLYFHEAALFQWANPKALIMAISTSGAFIAISDNIHLRAIFMGGIALFFAVISTTIWTVAGSGLGKLLSSGSKAVWLNAFMGLLLILTALIILLA